MNINKRGFWENNNFEGHVYDEKLSEALAELFKGSSVVDLGCGHGTYTYHFKKQGIDAHCFDGNPFTEKLTDGMCGVMDLSQDVDHAKQYDYVLCLEVGEHIPTEFEQTLINNIHKLNRKGVVLSWAVEGQGGDGHVNCRNNVYIRDIFAKLGYRQNMELENKLRDSAVVGWFKNTIMVFEK